VCRAVLGRSANVAANGIVREARTAANYSFSFKSYRRRQSEDRWHKDNFGRTGSCRWLRRSGRRDGRPPKGWLRQAEIADAAVIFPGIAAVVQRTP